MSNALLSAQETDTALLATVERSTILETMLVEQLEREMQTLVDGQPQRHVIVDLNRVELLCSAGIGVLVNQYRRAQDAGVRFALCGLRPSVLRLLAITRLDKVFAIYPDVGAAQQELSNAPAGSC